MTSGSDNSYKVVLSIPFPKKQTTEICYSVLRVDQEPSRSCITKNISIIGDNLVISFIGNRSKNVRVAVASFLDSLMLCCETIMEFGNLNENENSN